ncbi:pentapeptide repeat protein [Laceyella sacchari]|uniref:pentapeptide repeat-containing protein n=1 Tax=Laceyella sacchari TaxID=37482 RepID=UPI001042CC80|nr:pentapeptide repeat-containing protein [Laceyella sacchari]TCW39065.1 pentapeptide repeat protein [Laceyella sacchari]
MGRVNKEKIVDLMVLHRIWIETIGEKGEKLSVDEIDFRGIDLTEYPLDQAYMTACIFDGMNLSNKDMFASLMCSSTFRSTNLKNADFYKADVSYVDFTNANAQNARFAKSDCIETIFIKVDLTNAVLVNSLFDHSDFREATLQNVDVSGSYFEGVLLKGAKLTGIKGIEEANIKSINIGTPECPILLEGEKARQWFINRVKDG